MITTDKNNIVMSMANQMATGNLMERIARVIEMKPDSVTAYEDMYNVCSSELKKDEERKKSAIGWLVWLAERCNEAVIRLFMRDLSLAQRFTAVHKKALRAAAPDHFDSYIQYIEWEREPEKKFYAPRRKVLKTVVDALQDLADDKLDLLAISLPPGAGKRLSDDTPIMTKNGWKNHGDLVVGDYVVGLDGAFKRVEHVFPKGLVNYEVEFTNGEIIKCHGKHEWVVWNRHRQKMETLETEDMLRQGIDSGEPNKRSHRYYFMLPACEPMVGQIRELPVDPYVFGAWLGDGTTGAPCLTICNNDVRIAYEVARRGYGVRHVFEQVGCKRYVFNNLREDLQKVGLCKGHKAREKYIPEEYITASIPQRLDLIAGMIDTDGTLDRARRYTFSTTNTEIYNGFCELISSMGWRFTTCIDEPRVSSSGIAGRKDVYKVMFCPTLKIPCRVPRKKMNVRALERRIAIKAIRPIAPVQGNCIQVEGGIYRAGKTMLPTHNSTLAIFYLTWLAGRIPDKPMLTGSHSNAFVRGVYDECLRILDKNGEYLWHDVFPYVSVSNTNAKDCRIDLGERKRFETLEFTSIGTGNAGLYRAATLLYCDDLVSGIEVALSKERLDKLWETYTTDLRQRKIGDKCKELHIATRWSVHDVIGRLEREYSNNPRAKFIVIPAVDENDESNFDYAYGVGFTTKFFREQRDIMDPVSWKALYMNQPVEREGLVYDADELRRFFDLPEQEPDAVIAVCDTKDKGKDYASLPVAYIYGQDYYIADCLCDNGLPDVVDSRMVEILMRNKVGMARFESNNAGGRTAQRVQEEIKKRHGRTSITTKFTKANKETRIIVSSAWVKEHCIFKDESTYKRNTDYGRFMDMLCSYTLVGNNKHDDVPDSMAMLYEFATSMTSAKIEVFSRPF